MSWQMQSAWNTPTVRVKCILAIVIISCLSNNIPLLPLLMEVIRYSVTTHTALKLCSQLPKTVDTRLGLRSRLHPQGGPSTGQCLVQKQTTFQLPLIILSHDLPVKSLQVQCVGKGQYQEPSSFKIILRSHLLNHFMHLNLYFYCSPSDVGFWHWPEYRAPIGLGEGSNTSLKRERREWMPIPKSHFAQDCDWI